MIEDTGKPLWITEGGTGGHHWPEPLTGIAAAIYNAAVYGNVSAFTPWQVTDPHANTHGMMIFDMPTPKTYTAQHFFGFIDAGAVRVDASPVKDEINIAAFYHPDKKDLTVVLINPTDNKNAVNVQLKGQVSGLSNLKAFRTSETERMNPVEVNTGDGFFKMTIPALSIVTVQGKVD